MSRNGWKPMTAYDYPLLGFFWTVFIVFIWVVWIILLIRVFADIFRTHRMVGGKKALWVIFVVILPFLGVLIYLIVHGGDMAQGDFRQVQAKKKPLEANVGRT